jgi:hypothetical protein
LKGPEHVVIDYLFCTFWVDDTQGNKGHHADAAIRFLGWSAKRAKVEDH